MIRESSFGRRTLSLLLAAAFATAPMSAFAQDKEACVTASESGQKLRKQKKLRAARKELLACAQETCPAVVKKDCVTWLAEVDESLPTIILSAKDGSGNDVVDAKVLLDGEPFEGKLDGSAIAIDPGAHTFRFEPAKGEAVESKVIVREAEKNRVITVTLGEKPKPVAEPAPPPTKPATPEAPKASSGIPTSAYVLGGVAAASFVGFAYFGLSGRADRDHLLDTCAPYCSKDDEKPARNRLLIADIALGVGIVSLGVATVLVLTAPSAPKADKAALRVDAVPVAGGAVGLLGGSF